MFGSAMARRRTGSKDRSGISFQATPENTWQVGFWLRIEGFSFLFFSPTNCVQICVHVYSCEQLVPLADHCQKSWVNWCLLLGMAEQNGRKINLCKNTIANCGNIGYVVLNQASLRRQHTIHSA